jgi:tetratricopeptide (TPR) repeat protein
MRQAFLLLLIISSFSYGQTKYDKHDRLISEANNLRKDGNYEQAIVKYQNALEILIPNSSTPFFNLAECALKLDNLTLTDEWIRKGVSVGGAPKSYLENYKVFTDIKNHEFYKKIVLDYNQLRQKYFSSIDDIDLYLEIEELTSRDQFVRKTGMYLDGYSEIDYQNAGDAFFKAKRENDTVKAKELEKIVFHKTKDKYKETTSKLMQKVDSLNIARLMEISKKHGWQERAWVILWHQRGTYGEDNYIWNYFKSLIDKEISEGKLSRNFWNPFDKHKEMMEQMKSGNFNTIQVGKKSKKEIKIKEEKIKG